MFVIAGTAFIGSLGVEADEALPAAPLFQPKSWYYAVHLGHARIPLMHMSYLGTLKTWIWRPFFHFWGTGVWPLRFPAVLAGALSIWLFYCFLRAIVGLRAAVLGCVILAADSQYLLTTTFDWGPVALQHLLIGAGLVLLLRFYRSMDNRWLAAACFLLGLAAWDKMLALWMLSGLGVAALAAVPHQIRAAWSSRRLAIAGVALLAGAFPALLSSVHDHLAVLRDSAARDPVALTGKITLLERTIDGEGLFGYMFAEDWQTPAPPPPANLMERWSAGVSERLGHPRRSLQLYACVLALLLAPLTRGRELRALLFAWTALAVAWGMMAANRSAGGSVHHTVLLWPLPAMILAVSFAAASRRLGRAGIPAVAVILALLAGSDLLVTNEYFRVSTRNGGSRTWSDAVFPLAGELLAAHPAAIYCADWNLYESLRLLGRGALPLRVGMDPVPAPGMVPADQPALMSMVAMPGALWVTHVPEMEFFAEIRPKWDRFAAAAGYQRRLIRIIGDSHGRPTFELYRFQKVP